MATQSPGASAPSSPSARPLGESGVSTDLLKLQSTLADVSALSRAAFTQIDALAGMALKLMETESAYQWPEAIAQVLEVIRNKSVETNDLVDYQAGEVGCSSPDHAAYRRLTALGNFRNTLMERNHA